MDNTSRYLKLTVLVALVALSCAQSPFSTMPSNTYAIRFQNVTLDCAMINPSTIFFWKNPSGTTVAQCDQDGGTVADGFTDKYEVLRRGTNSWSLRIISADAPDVGKYQCDVPFGSATAYAEVFVLLTDDSDEICTEKVLDTFGEEDGSFGDMLEDHTLNLECQIVFYGNQDWPPKQDWYEGNNILTPTFESGQDYVKYTNNMFNVERDYNGKTWRVDSWFADAPAGALPDNVTSTPSEYYSSVRPTWSSSYTSTEIVVYFPADGDTLVIADPQTEYIPGDELYCTVEGNPEPKVSWMDVNNNNATVSDSGTLRITEGMVGSQTYRCTAFNTVRGANTTVGRSLSFNVTIPPTTTTTTTETPTEGGTVDGGGGTSTDNEYPTTDDSGGLSGGVIAAIVICVIFVLIVVALLLYFCCLRKAPQKKQEKPKPKPSQPVGTIPTDHIRAGPNKPMDNLSYISEKPPPSPYSPYANPYAIPNSHGPQSPYEANNLHYADLALDDTPRSRKPIQLYTPLDQLQA